MLRKSSKQATSYHLPYMLPRRMAVPRRTELANSVLQLRGEASRGSRPRDGLRRGRYRATTPALAPHREFFLVNMTFFYKVSQEAPRPRLCLYGVALDRLVISAALLRCHSSNPPNIAYSGLARPGPRDGMGLRVMLGPGCGLG